MSQVLEQLQLSVGSLGKNWCAERLHDLLDGDILVGELVSSGAILLEKRTGQHYGNGGKR
jgi:hypothetical protein